MHYKALEVVKHWHSGFVQVAAANYHHRLLGLPGAVERGAVVAIVEQAHCDVSANGAAKEVLEPLQVNIRNHRFGIGHHLAVERLLRHIKVVEAAAAVHVVHQPGHLGVLPGVPAALVFGHVRPRPQREVAVADGGVRGKRGHSIIAQSLRPAQLVEPCHRLVALEGGHHRVDGRHILFVEVIHIFLKACEAAHGAHKLHILVHRDFDGRCVQAHNKANCKN